ncbi:hypothetical protein M8J75_014432 [Diaphorina citri]|nr:hypothetical protein M8J75_014432 [Diaphorina citri]
MMLSRPPGDLSHFLMRDFNLQKKALDFLNFRHHLDMEEEWNENSAAQVAQHYLAAQMASHAAQASRKENHSPMNSMPGSQPMFKRKKVVREDGSSENKWVMDPENGSSENKWVMDPESEVLRDISTSGSGDRPLYSCENCGKSYLWKQGLNTHKRLHCGKEPRFQCPHCPKKCYQRGNLESHIRNVHSINPITGEFIAAKNASPGRGGPSPALSRGRLSPSPGRGGPSPALSRGRLSPSPGRGGLSPALSNGPSPLSNGRDGLSPALSNGPSPSLTNGRASPLPPGHGGPFMHPDSVNGPFNLSKHFGPSTVKATGVPVLK